jgi:hypothetical protein
MFVRFRLVERCRAATSPRYSKAPGVGGPLAAIVVGAEIVSRQRPCVRPGALGCADFVSYVAIFGVPALTRSVWSLEAPRLPRDTKRVTLMSGWSDAERTTKSPDARDAAQETAADHN